MDKEKNSKTIYLDNAATTFPKPESVYTEMDYVNRNLAVNTGRGSYSLARKATEIIDRTREKALKLIKGKDVADIVLTPSATIAMNVIIGGLDWSGADICYVSPFEHNAVMRPLHLISEKYGFDLIELPLKSETLEIDFEKMEYMFSMNPPTKVFATHISNVTGYILPVKEITEMAKKYNSQVIIDASQSLGLLDINMNNLMADFIAFAGHKNLYGPFGTSGFFVRKGTKINPFISGGTGSDSLNLNMPKTIPAMLEPASPNIVAVAGMEAALDETIGRISDFEAKEKELTEYLVKGLEKIENITTYLPLEDSHIGIVAFNIEGYKAEDVGTILDQDYHIAVRTGYHCAPLIHKYLMDIEKGGVVRASVGRYTTRDDIEKLLEAVEELSEEM